MKRLDKKAGCTHQSLLFTLARLIGRRWRRRRGRRDQAGAAARAGRRRGATGQARRGCLHRGRRQLRRRALARGGLNDARRQRRLGGAEASASADLHGEQCRTQSRTRGGPHLRRWLQGQRTRWGRHVARRRRRVLLLRSTLARRSRGRGRDSCGRRRAHLRCARLHILKKKANSA